KAEELYKQANDLYNAGKYTEAAEMYQKALDEVEASKKQVPVCKLSVKDKQPQAQQAQVQQEPEIPKVPVVKEYSICEQDVLYVYVWQNDDLSQEVIVRPDGRISFPLIGDCQARGLTVPQLTLEITEKLKEYIKFPQVTVSVRRLGGQRVFVLGQVKTPGIYYLAGDRSVIEALSYAGWVTNDSLSSTVIVIKDALTDHPKPFRVSVNKILEGKTKGQDMLLDAGDVVFVPKKQIADINYVVSTILDPIAKGAYTAQSLDYFF
ncbi:MAG: polysaccharide biosynthesis/export family protein, partial [Candidatus Omnitrophica bacterium]|nr:polysaccharide biosynthesis/export family protein [Candidatus Omnitrophota bacterium]